MLFLIQEFLFLRIPASATDAAMVNLSGMSTSLANGLLTFFINGILSYINGPRSLTRNPPDYVSREIFSKSLTKFTTSYQLIKIFKIFTIVSPLKLSIILNDCLRVAFSAFFADNFN